MLCEECKLQEASYTISVMVGNEVTQRHLCADCMAKMHMSLASGNIRDLLSTFLSAISGAAQEEKEEKPEDEVTCPRCETTWSQFTRTGHLGCPGCYEAFRERLQPMLLQVHGRVQHAGRRPLNTEKAQRVRTQREELAWQMEQAVALEDFETAAALRDRIRALSEQKEPAPDAKRGETP